MVMRIKREKKEVPSYREKRKKVLEEQKKRNKPKVQLPEGKTIGIAYNKGNYQVVDATDFKTMGRKV